MKNTAYRHVNLLPWKETLLLKAKALNFIEVYCSLERKKNRDDHNQITFTHFCLQRIYKI